MPFTTAVPYPFNMTPMANVGPVTYPDGTTFMREITAIKTYLNETLVPDFNAGIENAIVEYQNGITTAEATITTISAEWDTHWQAFLDNNVLELAALNDTAVASLITGATGPMYTALTALIDARAVSPVEQTAAIGAALADYTTTSGLTTLLAGKVSTSTKGVADGVASLDGTGKVPAGQLPTPAAVNGTGLYSARPAAGTVPAGFVYYATNVQETYRSTGVVWTVVGTGGNELGYAEISGGSMTTTTSTTGVDIPGLTVSFTAGERPVQIVLEGQTANFAANKITYIDLLVGGTVRRIFPQIGGESDKWSALHAETRIGGLTAGTTYAVTVKLRTEAPATSDARFASEAYLQVINR